MKWESKNSESYLHVDGYKNQYGKDIIAGFAFCEHKDKTIMYSVYINGDTGELVAYDEEHARNQVEGLVKAFCTRQIEYYDNIRYQIQYSQEYEVYLE